jgi:hypothetical protein
MPLEPPAIDAGGNAVSPMCSSTASTGAPSASAAIWVSAVQVPVPMSAAPIRTVYRPSAAAWIVAADPGRRKVG